jgi:hypothetical protein
VNAQKIRPDDVAGMISRPITNQMCADVLVTALQGGSYYWLGDYAHDIERAPQPLYYAALRFLVGENHNAPCEVLCSYVDYPAIARAMHNIVHAGKWPNLAADVIHGLEEDGFSGDANVADCILQFAVFNDVVFG